MFTLGTTALLSTIAGMVCNHFDIFCWCFNWKYGYSFAAGEQFLEQVKLRLLQVLLMEQETFQAL
jgi:hypothetical protein